MACLVAAWSRQHTKALRPMFTWRPERQLARCSHPKLDAWVRCVGQAALPSHKANRPWISDALGQMRCQDAAV